MVRRRNKINIIAKANISTPDKGMIGEIGYGVENVVALAAANVVENARCLTKAATHSYEGQISPIST